MKTELIAEALELYTNHPMAGEAVAAIEAAFGQAIKAMGEGMKKGAAYGKFVGPVMNQYAQAGASDSEAHPRCLQRSGAISRNPEKEFTSPGG